jgi:chromosome segregation ATPase
MTEPNNEKTVKELETIIGECDTAITDLLLQVEELKKKKKEAEDKLKVKTDKETATSTALGATKTKAELLREKIKKAHLELKTEIETPPKSS